MFIWNVVFLQIINYSIAYKTLYFLSTIPIDMSLLKTIIFPDLYIGISLAIKG